MPLPQALPFPLSHRFLLLLCFSSTLAAAARGMPSTMVSAAPPNLFPGPSPDALALLAFKSTVGDPSGALASWNDSLPFCSWRGVACGRRHRQRVVALGLRGLGLAGPVPPPLANLTFLRHLHLGENTFRGRIPPELGRLFRLQYLNLSLNSITGEIPTNLSHCTNLRTLSLRSNEIEGKIPGWVGSLPQLSILALTYNRLTGPIPPSLANLSTSLRGLGLFGNDLVGNIPVELGRMANLQLLDVGFNRLSGRVPPSVYNLSSLTVLIVAANQLSGTLPPDIGQALPRLQSLLFYKNLFHGPIPSSFPNATELRQLELGENQFGGAIPPNLGGLPHLSVLVLQRNRLEGGEVDDWAFLTSLTNCSHLRVLQLDVNNIRGTLPTSVANMSTELEVLSMGFNNLSGRIPPGIGNLISLTALDAEVCQLSGDIPETVGSLRALRKLVLDGNNLSGQIPTALGNLTLLTDLLLNFNELRGSIPTSFEHLSALQLLDLSYNQLSGNIPREVVGLSSLSLYLNLSHNSLSGSLPAEVGSLKNLVELDVSENRLSGEIPSSVGECQVLQYLHMQGNLFQGTIPPSLNSRALMVMDLSRNNLSGPIPKFLAGMQLQFLNLSFNSFQGQVPSEGVFRNLSSISIAGNRGLCGGDPVLKLPDCPVLQTPRSRRRHMPKALVTVVVAVPALCVALITLCYLFGKRCWKHHPSHKSSPPAASPFDHYEKVSYGELLKATDGFSPENVLGVGSFGSVYKGVLGPEEKAVAVKVLDLGRHGASKSFTAECQALRNVRHRNLAKVLTSCSGIDFKGDDFKAMVFEFMENGSLEEWLHPGTTGSSD
uniref:non-specific serine/threonine protein kinase n=1 Tax=Anthurium amnicola TaxID=1678845 RepID=A0A1D1XMJ6_9ARAE